MVPYGFVWGPASPDQRGLKETLGCTPLEASDCELSDWRSWSACRLANEKIAGIYHFWRHQVQKTRIRLNIYIIIQLYIYIIQLSIYIYIRVRTYICHKWINERFLGKIDDNSSLFIMIIMFQQRISCGKSKAQPAAMAGSAFGTATCWNHRGHPVVGLFGATGHDAILGDAGNMP